MANLCISLICFILSISEGICSRELAKGKNAESSLLHKPYRNASNAVDGDVNPNVYCNSCLHTARNDLAFLRIDLQHIHSINRVEIFFVEFGSSCDSSRVSVVDSAKKRSKGYSVQITMNKTLHGAPCFTDNTTDYKLFQLNQSQQCLGTGQYVIVLKRNFSGEEGVLGAYLMICELKVYGCPFGSFGENCMNSCGSRNCLSCHPNNGNCWTCRNGWYEPHCTTECNDTTYGRNCTGDCGKCRNNRACNKSDGTCPNSECAAGYKGPYCKIECSDFEYGPNCAERCGFCRNGNTCNKVTGNCPNLECERGYKGPQCKILCDSSSYGFNCVEKCGRCRNSTKCDIRFGNCSNGQCDAGFEGPRCNRECDEGFYGYNCNESCGFCAYNASCDKKNGVCPQPGCVWGYKGQECKTRCAASEYGRNCKSTCGYCRDFLCNQVNGTCMKGCLGENLPPLCLFAPSSDESENIFAIVGNVLALLVIVGVFSGIFLWLWRRQIGLKRMAKERSGINPYEDLRCQIDGPKINMKDESYATLGESDLGHGAILEGSKNETYTNMDENET